MLTFLVPGPLYPPSLASEASVPIIAMLSVAVEMGNNAFLFCNNTTDSSAASSAIFLCAASKFADSVALISRYGVSNKPSSNFALSTRLTASSKRS